MICDKCGFEHNSRSVCPKCGERVVYVNEDYLKRRQEWEEAQKKGQKDALPPGIMHSTLEERKAAKKHADGNADTQKGGPETASLSFRVKEVLNPKKIKEYFKIIAGKFIVLKDKTVAAYKRRFVKRRGVDNPVIRELKFDDRPDTLDESTLVVSHKVYKDYRKYIFIGAGAVVVLVAIIITSISVIKNIDHSDILFFDGKYAYLASDSEKALWGNLSGDIKIVYCDENECISYDNENIYLYRKKKTYTVKASNPEIITFSDELDTIIYKSAGITYLYHKGESVQLDIPTEAEFTNEVKVSPEGCFFALTACENVSGENYYKLYLGDSDGNLEAKSEVKVDVISEGNGEFKILKLADDGKLTYLEMDTAEYGIVNSKNIMQYDGSKRCIAENVDAYKLSQDEVYYIKDDKLYYGPEKIFIDDEVTEFVTNIISEEVIYWKNGLCYEINNLEPAVLCAMPDSNYSLVYESGSDFYAYYDSTDFNVSEQGEVTKFDLKDDAGVVISEGVIYVLNKKEELIKISDEGGIKIEVIYGNVTEITEVEGDNAIAFLSNESVYVSDGDKMIKIFDSGILTDVIYARKKYYISDEMGILWEVNNKGKEKKSLGNTEIYILVE